MGQESATTCSAYGVPGRAEWHESRSQGACKLEGKKCLPCSLTVTQGGVEEGSGEWGKERRKRTGGRMT